MASKKRGLSLDEKRKRMLDIFHEKKSFFLLKELEKIAPKEKGIISQSVKDVLQSLVDDDLVETDKIGTSVYFWSFPSKHSASRKRKLDETEIKLEETNKKRKLIDAEVKSAKKGREDSEQRTQVLEELEALKAKKEELEEEIKKYKDSDPEILKKLRDEIKMSKEGANRWTDNIFCLQSWISKKFPSISIAEMNKQFGVPEDLDYVS